MKKISQILMGSACAVALTLSTATAIKVYAAQPQVNIAGQPVDLTYAAEKAIPAVVHIKYVQNSKASSVLQTRDKAVHASNACRPRRKKLRAQESSSPVMDIL